jgi:hypothetical protein
VAETVDDTVGRIYAEPTSAALLAAIDTWESQGCPHDPTEARKRAEALSVPVFRDRILKFLTEVVTRSSQHVLPPAPHLRDLNRQGEGTKTGRIEEGY